MKKTIIKGFLIILSVVLLAPACLTILNIKTTPRDPFEKKISLNFRRNFPFKAELVDFNNHIKNHFLGIDPLPGKVVDAGDGWKFLGDDFGDAFSESKGMVVFNASELNTIRENLLYRKSVLDSLGSKFILAVGPNKLTVYPEKFPLKNYQRKTKLQQIDSLCNAIGVEFINLGENFEANKSKMRLYHRTDTHWNDFAGFLANQEMMKSVISTFADKEFIKFELEDMKIDTTLDPIGDLNQMLRIKKEEAFIHFDFKDKQDFEILEPRLPIRKDYHKDPAFYELRYRSPQNDLKLVMICDSFSGYFRRYFKCNFGETLILWDFVFNPDIMKSEQPDIVIHEIVERDLDFLMETYY
jgi:hypothetical protein